MTDLDRFLEERTNTRIPSGDVARVKLLAKELALGVANGLWDSSFNDVGIGNRRAYLAARWSIRYLDSDWHVLNELLIGLELAEPVGYTAHGGVSKLTKAAFDLIDETEPYDIFISYKRSESSAFALLVLARLKEYSLVPFVDMALEAGGNWHAELEERIKGCDYFIILLGKETLASPTTIKEIKWALDYKKPIIPVWHSEFDIGDSRWAKVVSKVKDAIQETNAIRVTDESASGYNTAIVALLNRFGITP